MSFDGFDADAVALLAELPTWDADRFASLLPVHRWLVQHLT